MNTTSKLSKATFVKTKRSLRLIKYLLGDKAFKELFASLPDWVASTNEMDEWCRVMNAVFMFIFSNPEAGVYEIVKFHNSILPAGALK